MDGREGTAARVVRSVLNVRGGFETPCTDSLLETLAIQLMREDVAIPVPVRQFPVFDPRTGRLVARLDLCWPELRLFLELHGQQHKGQPLYDAHRQTRVTALTGWRCGRLTWDEVTLHRKATLRHIHDLVRA